MSVELVQAVALVLLVPGNGGSAVSLAAALLLGAGTALVYPTFEMQRTDEQYASDGGELLVCPICLNARGLEASELVPNARVGGATPLWEWVGDGATVFSY